MQAGLEDADPERGGIPNNKIQFRGLCLNEKAKKAERNSHR